MCILWFVWPRNTKPNIAHLPTEQTREMCDYRHARELHTPAVWRTKNGAISHHYLTNTWVIKVHANLTGRRQLVPFFSISNISTKGSTTNPNPHWNVCRNVRNGDCRKKDWLPTAEFNTFLLNRFSVYLKVAWLLSSHVCKFLRWVVGAKSRNFLFDMPGSIAWRCACHNSQDDDSMTMCLSQLTRWW